MDWFLYAVGEMDCNEYLPKPLWLMSIPGSDLNRSDFYSDICLCGNAAVDSAAHESVVYIASSLETHPAL